MFSLLADWQEYPTARDCCHSQGESVLQGDNGKGCRNRPSASLGEFCKTSSSMSLWCSSHFRDQRNEGSRIAGTLSKDHEGRHWNFVSHHLWPSSWIETKSKTVIDSPPPHAIDELFKMLLLIIFFPAQADVFTWDSGLMSLVQVCHAGLELHSSCHCWLLGICKLHSYPITDYSLPPLDGPTFGYGLNHIQEMLAGLCLEWSCRSFSASVLCYSGWAHLACVCNFSFHAHQCCHCKYCLLQLCCAGMTFWKLVQICPVSLLPALKKIHGRSFDAITLAAVADPVLEKCMSHLVALKDSITARMHHSRWHGIRWWTQGSIIVQFVNLYNASLNE